MVSVKGSFVTSGPRLQAPPYHAIVSRMLQKQFVHACVCSVVVSYICSYIVNSKHGFWNLFPWTWTGLRTIAIFLSIFPLFLVRKTNLHVITTEKSTLAGTLLPRFFSYKAVRAFIVYLIAASLLTRIYLNNCVAEHALSILTTQKSYELPRLNERWLYLNFFGVWIGCLGACHHILRDLDFLDIPLHRRPVPERLTSNSTVVIRDTTLLALLSTMTAPIAYVFIRVPLFHAALRFARLFYRLPKANILSGWPVGFGILWHSLLLASCVLLLCCSLNMFFDVYLSQGPYKKGRLASEKSMQSDETLLTGLFNQDRPLTQFLAFEELAIIAQNDNQRARRIKIFEAGSPDATVWLKIVEANLRVFNEGSVALKKSLGIISDAPAKPVVPQNIPQSGASPLHVQQANIFKTGPQKQTALEKLKSQTASIAENQNQIMEVQKLSQNATESIHQHVRKLIQPVIDHLPKDGVTQIERASRNVFSTYKLQILAIQSLQGLLLHSLEEDTYGRVYRDVLKVLLECFQQLKMVDAYIQRYANLPPSHLQEPKALKNALISCMTDVGIAFENYIELSQQPALQAQIQAFKPPVDEK